MSDKDKIHISQPETALQKSFGVVNDSRHHETAALSPRPDAKGADPKAPPRMGPPAPPQAASAAEEADAFPQAKETKSDG